MGRIRLQYDARAHTARARAVARSSSSRSAPRASRARARAIGRGAFFSIYLAKAVAHAKSRAMASEDGLEFARDAPIARVVVAECALFTARARVAVERAVVTTTPARGFSIAAAFGLGDGGGWDDSRATRRLGEFTSASTVAIAIAEEGGGWTHACACAGTGRRGSGSGVGGGRERLENFIAARDARAPGTRAVDPWYEGSRAKVLAMAHSRTGERAVCCVASGGVYVVPIAAMARGEGGGGGAAMRVLASRGPRPVSAVWWYRMLEREREDDEVAICVGVDGEVRAWDAKKGVSLGACVVGGKCVGAEIARGETSQFLVINGAEGEVWTLMLECMTRVVKTSTSVEKGASRVEATIKAESLPDAAGSHGFAAHALKNEYGVREGRRVTLSVHETGVNDDARSAIAALIDRNLLELYDVDDAATPKSTHALPEHTVSVHVTDDLIFALVREPVFGVEDLNDITSFTASVHVIARRFDVSGSTSLTLQTFHIPRSAGVPRKLLPGPVQGESTTGRRETLRGCMVWTSYGLYEIEPSSDVQSSLRRLLLDDCQTLTTSSLNGEEDDWEPIDRVMNDEVHTIDDNEERVKLLSRVLEEDSVAVFIEAARRELKRQRFSRARTLFGKTGKPLKDFIALSLEVWEASQALTNFSSSSTEAYGGHANMTWLKTATAAHAHLHAWCKASTAVALSAAKEINGSLEARMKTLSINRQDSSPGQVVNDLLSVIGEGVDVKWDDPTLREAAFSASAAVVAFEAANAVSETVSTSCASDTYSDRVRELFTVILASSSTLESLHMLGGITANATKHTASDSGGVIVPWEPKPLVFWDPNVTFYVTATQSLDDLHDIVTTLGLRSDYSNTAEATPLEMLYDTLTKDELSSLASMAIAATKHGVVGAFEVEMSIFFRLEDEDALGERIERALDDSPAMFAWIIAKCVDKRKFLLAEAAALKMEDYATAALCHVAHVRNLAASGNATPSTLQAELEIGLESCVALISSTRAQVKSIEGLARCWRELGLATDELERAFSNLLLPRGHAEALQIVLKSDIGFTFSGRFVLAIARQRIADNEAKYLANESATIENIWSQIKSDVAKRMVSPEMVQTKPFKAVELDAVNANGMPQCWAFTCGHRYSSKELKNEVAITNERLKLLDLPVTSILLESDYELRRCSVACPSCTRKAVELSVERYRAAATA